MSKALVELVCDKLVRYVNILYYDDYQREWKDEKAMSWYMKAAHIGFGVFFDNVLCIADTLVYIISASAWAS